MSDHMPECVRVFLFSVCALSSVHLVLEAVFVSMREPIFHLFF